MVFLPLPSVPDMESLTSTGSDVGAQPCRAPTPLTLTRGDAHAGLGLSRLQSFATMGNTQQFLADSSFSCKQLLSAVSGTKVRTFCLVKESAEPSGL